MANISPIDIRVIDDALEMGSGYVLDFSDRTFAEFFDHYVKVNIDDPAYAIDGASKAKRLRRFLKTVPDRTAAQALNALWKYRQKIRRGDVTQIGSEAVTELSELIVRLGGTTITGAPVQAGPPGAKAPVDKIRLANLSQTIITIAGLEPHPRGYAFEKFLKDMFDAYALEAKDAFRLRGEQIDGSFQLANDTYLVEAKWQNAPIGAAELHTFQGKIAEKAAWSRGLFISQSGFTDDGLYAFGRGKQVICMDGLDLYELLNRGLPLEDVLLRKVRRAAETGETFVRVRDLYLM